MAKGYNPNRVKAGSEKGGQFTTGSGGGGNAYRLPDIDSMRSTLDKNGISTSHISKNRTLLEQRRMLTELMKKHNLNVSETESKTMNDQIRKGAGMKFRRDPNRPGVMHNTVTKEQAKKYESSLLADGWNKMIGGDDNDLYTKGFWDDGGVVLTKGDQKTVFFKYGTLVVIRVMKIDKRQPSQSD